MNNQCQKCIFALWSNEGDLIGCTYEGICNKGVKPYDD